MFSWLSNYLFDLALKKRSQYTTTVHVIYIKEKDRQMAFISSSCLLSLWFLEENLLKPKMIDSFVK